MMADTETKDVAVLDKSLLLKGGATPQPPNAVVKKDHTDGGWMTLGEACRHLKAEEGRNKRKKAPSYGASTVKSAFYGEEACRRLIEKLKKVKVNSPVWKKMHKNPVILSDEIAKMKVEAGWDEHGEEESIPLLGLDDGADDDEFAYLDEGDSEEEEPDGEDSEEEEPGDGDVGAEQ